MTKKFEPSIYQKRIFLDLAKGTKNTMIIARAGASKTYCLVEGAKYIPRGKKALFCAFNKSIRDELKKRLGSYVVCNTLHSLGFTAVKQRFGQNVELDEYKCWKIITDLVGDEEYDLIDNINKTVHFCKANLVDTPGLIEDLIAEYDIDLCELEPEIFIQYVCKALRKCKEMTNTVDYNDMVWFCFVYNIKVGNFDYVLIDEAQDMSKCLIEVALSAVKKNGRVIAVMDNFQAIYEFLGADSRVLENLRKRLNNPTELLLPICYRCPTKVVDLVKPMVPDIQTWEKAKEGEIIEIKTADLIKYAKPGSYVISRYNAPLIKNCLNFLKHGIPANMLGRDFGDNLLYLIKKSKRKKVDAFLKWLDDWGVKEKAKLISKYPNAKGSVIEDKIECLYSLCDGAKSIDEVKKNIDDLFKDNDESKIVLFSSSFKIKGKETSTAFVLVDTLNESCQTEINIKYVSFTRTKDKLYLVSG